MDVSRRCRRTAERVAYLKVDRLSDADFVMKPFQKVGSMSLIALKVRDAILGEEGTDDRAVL